MSTPSASRPVRYVILNADDFGFSNEVNSAVLQAHQRGTLTSASLMVAEPAWEQAVEIAWNTPKLGVGLHLCVSADRAVLPSDLVRDIVDSSGRFGADPFRVGLKYALSRRVRPQLLREMEAQFKRFAATGLPWSHADGHQHFHMHPAVWPHFIDLCDAYSVTRIRMPDEPVRAHLRSDGDRAAANILGLLAFRALRKRAARDLKARSVSNGRRYFVCDCVYGMLQTGNMNSAYLQRLIPRLQGATNEIYFHPGSPHAHVVTGDTRDVEFSALLDHGLLRAFAEQNIVAGAYSEVDLMHAAVPAIEADSRSIK